MGHILAISVIFFYTNTFTLLTNHFLLSASHIKIYAYIFSLSRSPIPTLSPTASPDANLAFNGTILAAIIGALVGLLGLAFGIFQFYQARKDELEKQRFQQEKEELQLLLNKAAQRQQFEDELEKRRYEDFLATRRATLEREQLRKASTQAKARTLMTQARTLSERTEAYRKALHTDPHISHLQILDMTYPMDVRKVYVRLRLHQETRLRYDIDTALLAAEEHGDPNSLIKARYALLETRSQAAMTPEEALRKYPRCIILGDPGAGKSTLLKYLTLQSVDQQLPYLPDLPVHIVLGDFASSPHQDLLRFAAERWDERYGFPEDEAQQYIESCLHDGNAILLLDALDETVIGGNDEIARDSYAHVLTAINQIAVRYSKAPIVVTARKAGYHQRAHLSGFTELEVLDFRPQESEEFVTNWFKYHPVPSRHVTANDLNTQLARNPRIQSLASNPLLLTLIILVYESRQELPERRAEIYSQCIDVLLFRWDTSRDIRRRKRFNAEHKKDLLTEIAWYFHTRGRRYFPEDELLQVIAKFLPTIDIAPENSRYILREIEEENGLLKEQAHGWHGFLHLTIQEYFVAQHLCNAEYGLYELLKHCGDPWWEEAMLLYVGTIPDATRFLRALLHMEKKQWFWKDIFHTSLLWAGQCLAAKPRRVQKGLRNEIIGLLFHILRKTPYSLIREHVTRILMNIDGSDARGKLLIMLKDRQEDSNVRSIIAETLGELEDHTVVPDLLALLKDTQQQRNIRLNAALALGQIGDHAVIPDMLAILKDTQEDSNVRQNIAQALELLGGQELVPNLLALLKNKQDSSDDRWYIAGALGALGDQAVIPDLLAILKDTQEQYLLRAHTAAALGALGDQAVIPDLLALLKDTQVDRIVRWFIAKALGILGDQAVIPDLLALLKDTQVDRIVRAHIAGSLGILGDQAVIPDLLALLKDTQADKIVREDVAEALIALGDQAVTPYLLAILKDKHEDRIIRFNVAKQLIRTGKQEIAFSYLSPMIREFYLDIEFLGITSDLMPNYASIRIFARLLRIAHSRNDYFLPALWEAAQREKVRILMFRFLGIKLVRVVKL